MFEDRLLEDGLDVGWESTKDMRILAFQCLRRSERVEVTIL